MGKKIRNKERLREAARIRWRERGRIRRLEKLAAQNKEPPKHPQSERVKMPRLLPAAQKKVPPTLLPFERAQKLDVDSGIHRSLCVIRM
jgi:hypothetical protein